MYSITSPAQGSWSTPQQVTIGRSARVARVALRAPASSAVTAAEIMLFQGDYLASDGTCTETNPGSTVPGENRVVHITSISVTGSATALDSDNALSHAAVIDVRGEDTCWLSLKAVTASGTQAGVKVVVEFVDVE